VVPIVTPGVICSTVASIAEKLPQPLKGVLLGAVKVVPVDLKVAPTPWTLQVSQLLLCNVMLYHDMLLLQLGVQ
jgi:hypothetical protein